MAPQSPSSNHTAAQLAALYALAEQVLLSGATRIIRRTTPTLESQQQAVTALRKLVRQVLDQLDLRTTPLIVAMVHAGTVEGVRDATRAVEKALGKALTSGGGGTIPPPPGRALAFPGEPFNLSMSHAEHSAQAIRDDLTSELQDVRFRITRLPADIYKAIAPHGAIYQVLDNAFTPAQAQAAAWRVFVSQGVTGFTDRSGRNWSLSAYTEMAVRTAAMRAYNASHLARMQALGVSYFTVPEHTGSCPLCFPWQNAILTDGTVTDPAVPVDGTIADATAAGLFHPNCRHPLVPFFPGVSIRQPLVPWSDDLAQAYAATQRQRELERAVRTAKRQLEYAADPEARATAAADVRAAQAKLRQFVNSRPDLARQSRREQLNLSDQRMKMPAPVR